MVLPKVSLPGFETLWRHIKTASRSIVETLDGLAEAVD